MVLVVALLVKALSAVFADEGFNPCVNPGVGVEGRRAIEGFSADPTAVRLFGCVDDLVATEGGGLAEALAAYLGTNE